MLRRSAARHGARTAIICGAIDWSYAEFDALVDRLAAGLTAHHVGPGHRIALLARNSHAFMAVRFAAARLGAILVPINFMLKPDDIAYILDHSESRMLFVDASTVEQALQACAAGLPVWGLPGELTPPPRQDRVRDWNELLLDGRPAPEDAADADDIAQIIYTSGTESRPKGAMLTHAAILWQYQSCIIDCEWTRQTIALHALPLFHCAQLDAMMGPALQIGARNIVTSDPAPANLLRLLAEHRVTSFFAPPTVWISLLRFPELDLFDLSHLVKGYYGASIMPVEILRELRRRYPSLRLWNIYGQTEIAPVATILFPEEHSTKIGSAGRPTQHVRTRVVDDHMRDVRTGEVGEIVHQSPQLMTGYWKDAERTAAAFSGGWFHSGDLATVDEDGYITIVDRKKDMIKTGGENVASREVEEAIYTHAGVSEVAVVGLPDPKWIEAVTAIVVLKREARASENDLMAHCRARLAGFKCPKRIIILDQLPRNASGKILKRDLRDHLASHHTDNISNSV